MSPEREQGGIVRDQTPEEAAAFEARQRPAPPTPIEEERARRAEADRAAAAERWERGCRAHGLWALLETVEQRLAALPAVLDDLERRHALAPRLVALEQDVLDEGLGPAWMQRVHALHRAVLSEPPLVANAGSARRLLDSITHYTGFGRGPDPVTGIVPADDTGLYRGWREQLTWYTEPLPEPSAARRERELEKLEADVLRALKAAR